MEGVAASSSGDVVFLGIVAKSDSRADATAFIHNYKITYPEAQDSAGGDALLGRIAHEYGIYGYPTTVFINASGLITDVAVRPLTPQDLEEYIRRAKNRPSADDLTDPSLPWSILLLRGPSNVTARQSSLSGDGSSGILQ